MTYRAKYKKALFILITVFLFTVHYQLYSSGFYFFSSQQSLPEWPLLVDILVTLPALYWLIFKPPLKTLLIKSLILFSAGIFIGSIILPEASKVTWPYLESLRYLLLFGFILIEISLLISLLHIIRVPTSINNNIESSMENFLKKKNLSSTIIELYLLEARVWFYAFFARQRTIHFGEGQHFSYANYNGNASNQQGFIFIILFELPIAHFIIHIAWSATAAYWITGLTIYGLIFMYADYKATLTRPITLTKKELHIRYGVWGNLRIPVNKIESIQKHSLPVKRSKIHLRFCQFGSPNICIILKPNTELQTAFGKSKKSKIYLGVDSPNELLNKVASLVSKI